MSASESPRPTTVDAVRAHLSAIAQLLRETSPLSPEAQHALAELVEQLGMALAGEPTDDGDEEPASETVLGQARDRLENVALAFDAEAPHIASATRQLIETLSNLGI